MGERDECRGAKLSVQVSGLESARAYARGRETRDYIDEAVDWLMLYGVWSEG